MNEVNKPKPINWRKVFWAFVLAGVIAYAYGEPYLEQWTGWDLPSIRDNGNVADLEKPDPALKPESRPGATAPKITKIGSRQDAAVKEQPSISQNSKPIESSTARKNNPYLTPTGKKNRLSSPAGLVYGESRNEHRVDHVMRHAMDNKNRPIHSVFEGEKEEILKLIDEAFELIKAESNRVRIKPDKQRDFRKAYTVDMQRKIGYMGGQKGRRENYPSRSKLTLVLDNEKFVVTAYPDN